MITEQLRFGNYKEQMEEKVEELKMENGCLGGELKGIFTKLETLEEKIEEEDEE